MKRSIQGDVAGRKLRESRRAGEAGRGHGNGSVGRGWWRLGPGVAAAAAISGFFLLSGRLKPGPEAPSFPARPRALAPPFPDPATLLRRRGALHLSPQQVEAIAALDREWRRRSEAERSEGVIAMKPVESYLRTARDRQRLSVVMLRHTAARVSAVSASLAGERRDYWERSLKLLHPDQRKRLLGGVP